MRSSYSYLKLFTMLFPPILIGSAEYIRHEWWTTRLSMEAGNLLITLIVLLLSCWFGHWMFRRIEAYNHRLTEERARRAVYEERERLAEELHDNIAQTLFFLNVSLQKGDTVKAKSAVAEINSHLRQAIFNLQSPVGENQDLELRLRRWLQEWSGVSGVGCDMAISLPKEFFSTFQEIKLFGLIQEAFTNIRKHSRATQASIRLVGHPGTSYWELTIKDNGAGLDRAEDDPVRLKEREGTGQAGGSKFGMAIMHRRATELGAVMEVRISQGEGTEINVAVRKEGLRI